MSLPSTIKSSSKKMCEKNDCTVKALAIATGSTYEEAHRVLKVLGRKNRKGVSTLTVEVALSRMGFNTEKIKTWKGKTAKTIDLPRKDNYIVFTCNHALAVKFGLVKDWTHNKANRIKEVWKITKKV